MSAWEEKHVMGKVLFDFKSSGQFQIDLTAGEKVEVLKMSSGWYRGRVIGREAKGIFPVSYIEILKDEPFPPAKRASTASRPSTSSSTTPIAAALAAAGVNVNSQPAQAVNSVGGPASAGTVPSSHARDHSQPSSSASTPTAAQAAAAAQANAAAAKEANSNTSSTSNPSSNSSSTATSAATSPTAASSSASHSQSASPAPGTASSGLVTTPLKTRQWAPPMPGGAVKASPFYTTTTAVQHSGSVSATPTHSSSISSGGSSSNNSAPSPSPSPAPTTPVQPTPIRTPPMPSAVNVTATPVRPLALNTHTSSPSPNIPSPTAAGNPGSLTQHQQQQKSVQFPGQGPNKRYSLTDQQAMQMIAGAGTTIGSPTLSGLTGSSGGLFLNKLNTMHGNKTLNLDKVDEMNEGKLKETMSVESLLLEIDHTVRDWSVAMRATLMTGNMLEYHRGMERLSALLEARRRLTQLEDPSTSADTPTSTTITAQRTAIRHEIIEMIEGSRKMAEGYMVPRNPHGQVADNNNTGIIDLLELHRSMYLALKEESSSVWIAKSQERKNKSFRRQEEMAKQQQQLIAANTSVQAGGGMQPPQTPSNAANGGGPGSPGSGLQVTVPSTPSNANGASGGMMPPTPSSAANGLATPSNNFADPRQSLMIGASGPGISLLSGLPSAAAQSSYSNNGKKQFPAGPLHLFLNVKMCIFSVGEATDLLFSLYSSTEQKFITEDYVLALSDQGLPINLSLIHKMRTIFVDLLAKDFEKDLWLVCRIYRRGKLVFDTVKPKTPQRVYRRPFGCAACSLTESNIDVQLGREYEPPNAAMTIYTCSDEAKFSLIHQQIIAKDFKALEPAPRAKGIALGLTLFQGELADIRDNMQNEMMTESDTPATHKMKFPDRLNPADQRNDFYVHLLSASYAQDGKKSAKNIEMSVRVVTDDGISVQDCITHGNADKSPVTEYHSTVYYHLNTPYYGETIRINISDQQMIEKCHLFISFWHVSTSKKISCFSFCFLPLTTEQGSIIQDAEYKLQSYKAFAKIESFPYQGGAYYLGGDRARPPLEVRKEYLTVRTQSLSTIKTQNLVLHSIFKQGRFQSLPAIGGAASGASSSFSLDAQGVVHLLDKFIVGLGKEHLNDILRFMRELFGTLFNMLLNPAYVQSHFVIFKAILHCLTLINEKKPAMSQAGPGGKSSTAQAIAAVNAAASKGASASSTASSATPTIQPWELLDEYISSAQLFSNPANAAQYGKLHHILMKYTIQILTNAALVASVASIGTVAPNVAKENLPDQSLLKLTKSLHYVLKFSLASRQIESGVQTPQQVLVSDRDFKSKLENVFQSINKLMAAELRDELPPPTASSPPPTSPGGAVTPASASSSAVANSPLQYLLPSQTNLVRSFPESLSDLLTIFTHAEMSNYCRVLILALPKDTLSVQQNTNKLNLIRNILISTLGENTESRTILMPLIISTLKYHLIAERLTGDSLNESYICIAILNLLLSSLNKEQNEFITQNGESNPELIEPYIELLYPILYTVLIIQQNILGTIVLKPPTDVLLQAIQIDISVDSITILWTLFSLLSTKQLENYIESLSEDVPEATTEDPNPLSPLQLFLRDFLQVCTNAISVRCYPDMWIVMNMMECTVMTKLLKYFATKIMKSCLKNSVKNGGASGSALVTTTTSATAIVAAGGGKKDSITKRDSIMGSSPPPITTNHRILRSFFQLIIDLLMYDQLKIENFPTRKKIFVKSRYGDLRQNLIDEFLIVWSALGSEKMEFIEPFIITKLFDLARGGKEKVPEVVHKESLSSPTIGSPNLKRNSSVTRKGRPNQPAPTLLEEDESASSRAFALHIYFDMIVESYNVAVAQNGGSTVLVRSNSANSGNGMNGGLGAGNGNTNEGPATSSDAFTKVERHTIDALYNLANINQEVGRKLMEQLSTCIYAKFQQTSNPDFPDPSNDGVPQPPPRISVSPELMKEGLIFLTHIQRMYELMSSLLKFPDTSLFEDERTSVALKLMSYLENSLSHSRRDMYTRYVQYLVDLHIGLKNFAEAGYTLVLAIRILSWNDSLLTPLDSTLTKYPQEKERERKEKMYLAAISFFKQGEEWERSIALAEELRNYYQFSSFEYLKLSSLMHDQSECFRLILQQERFYSVYFRVCYYGPGFDDELTGSSQGKEKEFVYRGVRLEPVMDFTNRIKKKFPEAKILMSSDRPTEELFAAHKQIISVTTLTRGTATESAELMKALANDTNLALPNATNASSLSALTMTTSPSSLASSSSAIVAPSLHTSSTTLSPHFPFSSSTKSTFPLPKNIIAFRENNDLSVFVYAKGMQKSPIKNPPNEFKHLWVSKTYIVTQESFPNNRRRMEVVHRKEVLLSPIENAISTMINKNNELRDKIFVVANARPGPVDVGPLSMNLNGMIDAAVMGGTQKYIEAFLNADYLKENAGDLASAKQQQDELKQSIKDQIAELKIGLEVFGERCDEKLRGLHSHLTTFYAQMVAKTAPVVA